MTAFQISSTWLPRKGGSELDVTMAALKFLVGNRNVTEFSEDDGSRCDHLEIPAYFLAEWIAENWWPLLWEPRKSEEGADDQEFVLRHSILAAQHGFALPRVTFVPAGRAIQITANARDAAFADVRFRNTAQASPPRSEVETELRKFVNAVCSRLDESHVRETPLHHAWQLVLDVDGDEEQFCRFAGALGLDPYDVGDRTATLLEKLLATLGERLLMDLCLVASPGTLDAIAASAETAFLGLDSADATDLEPLLSLRVPADNFAVPAWRRGVQAAKQLRSRMDIQDTDPSGATRVFEKLRLHTDRYGENVAGENSLTGAVARTDREAHVALLQALATQRRFAAARAIFAAWTSDDHQTRFLTSAVTRDQQANRAFAAELTAPYTLLRTRSRSGKLSQSQVFDLAGELQVGADVVAKQALNNGLQVQAF
jgi:hypothetical protein